MGRNKQIIITASLLILIVVVVVVCVTQIRRENDAVLPVNEPWKKPRLPKNVRPSNYHVALDVHLNDGVYNGTVKINVSIAGNATQIIRLHKVGYNITRTSIQSLDNGSIVQIAKTFDYFPFEFWVIETNVSLQPGKYEIILSFNAVLSDELNGFYKGSYEDNKGHTRRFAATFFSPISARKAFPCFDEPSFKAVFELVLTHEKDFKALANMPYRGTPHSLPNDRIKAEFLPTLNTSTYIVAWVITDFHSILFPRSNIKLTGWTPLNKNLDDLEYGLNITAVLLPKYEEYFKIDFPLKKLDVVTLPAFAPSAMENWGLIMFRNAKFLSSKTSTYGSKKEIARIQGHELVHQWFGNLATMKFWNEAWLKEGFATFIAYIVIEKINPSMEYMKDVLPDYMLKAMDIDSFSTSKPISRTVNTPNEIRQIFDSITYYKGCCMVQTLYWYMGKENFRRGMQRYLKTYSYSNANQDDLWHELSLESGGKDIKKVMDTWTKQIGHPVITTKRMNATHVQVKQDRFNLDPPGVEVPTSPFNYRWQVPIITRDLKSNQQKTHLLSTKEDIFPITKDEILNPDHSLYYRVNYGEETFARLVNQLNNEHQALTELDRAGLVSDYFYLFKAKLKTLNETLKILDYIENEKASIVWEIAVSEMKQVSGLIESDSDEELWRNYVLTKINKTVSTIGWDTKATYKESALQTVMLTFGCQMNISSVVNTAKQKFRDWMNNALVMDKNLYPVMRECAISTSLHDDIYFTYTYQKYLDEKDNALLTSLTTTKNPKLIESFLHDAMNKSIVKDNDATYTIGKIAKYSRQGKDLAWNLVKKRWSELFERYGDNIFLLARLLTSVLEDFSTDEKLKDIQTFFKEKKNLGSGKNAIDQAMLKIKFRIVYGDIINNDTWFS